MSRVLDLWAGMTGTIMPFAGATAPTGWLLCNGAAISRSTYPNLFKLLVTDPGYTAQTFTVTIATPAVVTKTGHGFTGGERVRLTTTGALPTGLALLTDYFVEYIDANTFYLNDASGTRINTSGTQSGTHSFTRSLYGLGDGSTTFNVPDLRGEFIRSVDAGRGVDANRVLGSSQKATKMFGHVGEIGPGQLEIGGENMDSYEAYSYAGRVVTSTGSTLTHYKTGVRPRSVALNHIIKAS